MQAESSQKPTWSIQKALVPLEPSVYCPAADLFEQTQVIRADLKSKKETSTLHLISAESTCRCSPEIKPMN